RDRDEQAVPHPARHRLVADDGAKGVERRVAREPGRGELVGRVGLQGRRDDEPDRVERRQADDHEEDEGRQRAAEASTGRRPHVAAAGRRTHNESPISTLAMPSSITATLAAVPLAPVEKLRQMYSSITLEE